MPRRCSASCAGGKIAFSAPQPQSFAVAPGEVALRAGDGAAERSLRAEHVDPLLAKILAARGINSKAELACPAHKLAQLPPGSARQAAELLAQAVIANKRICVVGARSTDGICAVTLAVLALRLVDSDALWHIGGRYGLDAHLVRQAARDGAQLLLIADCNGDLRAGLTAARKSRLRTITIGHHLHHPARTEAGQSVSAQQAGSGLPAGACATAVMFLLMRHMYRLVGSRHRPNRFLDLVAAAAAAKAAPMNEPFNRSAAAHGTHLISSGRCCNLFKEILRDRRSACNFAAIKSELAPLLQAACLHNEPRIGVDALLADSAAAARALAGELRLAKLRLGRFAHRQAQRLAQADLAGAPAAVLHRARWKSSDAEDVCELLAARLGLPALVLCGSGKSSIGFVRGNAEVSAVRVCEQLAAARPADIGFWHADQYAGRIRVSANLQACCRLFAKLCRQLRSTPDKVWIDADVTSAPFGAKNRRALRDMPWGAGFAAPLLRARATIARNLTVPGTASYRYLLKLGGQQLIAGSPAALGAPARDMTVIFTLENGTGADLQCDVRIAHVVAAHGGTG